MKAKKKTVITIAAIATLGVAVTFALFTTKFSVENKFKSGTASAEFIEDFKSPALDETVYGNTYEKSGKVSNTGDIPVTATAKIAYKWVNSSDNSDATVSGGKLSDNATYAFTLKFGSTVDNSILDFKTSNADNFDVNYTPISASDKTWGYDKTNNEFYYGKSASDLTKISKGESSSPIMESVYFDAKLGETTSDYYYYIINKDGKFIGLNGVETDPKEHKISFSSLDDAMNYAKNNVTDHKGIRTMQVSKLKNTEFEGKYLVVTISGTITEVK